MTLPVAGPRRSPRRQIGWDRSPARPGGPDRRTRGRHERRCRDLPPHRGTVAGGDAALRPVRDPAGTKAVGDLRAETHRPPSARPVDPWVTRCMDRRERPRRSTEGPGDRLARRCGEPRGHSLDTAWPRPGGGLGASSRRRVTHRIAGAGAPTRGWVSRPGGPEGQPPRGHRRFAAGAPRAEARESSTDEVRRSFGRQRRPRAEPARAEARTCRPGARRCRFATSAPRVAARAGERAEALASTGRACGGARVRRVAGAGRHRLTPKLSAPAVRAVRGQTRHAGGQSLRICPAPSTDRRPKSAPRFQTASRPRPPLRTEARHGRRRGRRHVGEVARLQGFALLESSLPPDGGLDHSGPGALLGFQPLQGLPFHRLGPMLPPALLSQAWHGQDAPRRG
jgi:hypothetical protein